MRTYRLLLLLCPPSLRREYGRAMEDTFTRRLADARARGRWALARAWRREITGLAAFAVAERYRLHLDARRKAGVMDTLIQELRLATRRLWRTPAFTVAAAATLALAIGANASIFAVVRSVVLNPLPYPESDRVIALLYGVPTATGPATTAMPVGLFYQFADRAHTLDSVAVFRSDELTLTGDGEPLRASVIHVSTSLGSVLQVPPALGRWFTAEEGAPGTAPAAVLSYGLWMRRYGGDAGVVGRTVTLNGVPTAVVGIMPASFSFPARTQNVDLWMADRLSRADGLGLFTHNGVARLRDGATVEAARAEMSAIITDLPQAYPGNGMATMLATKVRLNSQAVPLKERTIGSIARALWTLLAAVGLVLLVACANVANLFLVRSEARQREVAVRRALGAGRGGITRFFLVESAVLSAAGGVAGLAIAIGAVRLLVTQGPATLPRLHEVRLDGAGIAVTFGLSALTALVFGCLPLVRRGPLAAALHEASRGNTASRSRHRTRRLLMAGQVALALMVLLASGLMVRSLQHLRNVDPGFEPSAALTYRIGLPAVAYPTRAAVVAAHQAILDRLVAQPGIVAASAITALPLLGQTWSNTLAVEGRVAAEGTLPPIVEFHTVAGGAVEALGLRIQRGRGIDRGDVERRHPGVMVNQALVDAYFPGEDPIGRRIMSGVPTRQPMTIEGVVANTPSAALNEPQARPKLYLPMSIAGGPEFPSQTLLGPSASDIFYVVRGAGDPYALLEQSRAAVDGVDATLAMSQVASLQEIVERSSAQMAFTMVLLAIAAAVALALGVVGVYGVMSYIVTQRTGEIGVRLALGAAPSGIAGMIARQGGAVALAGIAVGMAGALAGGRFIESLLYGVTPRDPGVFVVTTLAVAAVALAACWLPARRAAKLSPLEALRPE